jgi:hypothetical protein
VATVAWAVLCLLVAQRVTSAALARAPRPAIIAYLYAIKSISLSVNPEPPGLEPYPLKGFYLAFIFAPV